MEINGITLKNVKACKDHEGCTIFQADVWKNHKKLGFWSQDSWGGEDTFDFPVSELDDVVNAMKKNKVFMEKTYQMEKTSMSIEKFTDFMDASIFLYYLIMLHDAEKQYKQYVKKDKTVVVYLATFYQTTKFGLSRTAELQTDEDILSIPAIKESMAKLKDPVTWICRSLDDFKIAL